MSNCCFHDAGSPCALPQSSLGFCPACGEKGKAVAILTVKSLVRDHTRVSASASFSFCRTAACDVVYFSSATTFRKPDIKVRVGIKETEDPVPLCYCFDYTREDVFRDIGAIGSTSLPDRIKTEVQAGFCACEVRNPSGSCCLGDITRAIQQARLIVVDRVSNMSQSVKG